MKNSYTTVVCRPIREDLLKNSIHSPNQRVLTLSTNQNSAYILSTNQRRASIPSLPIKKDCHSPLHSKKIFCSIPCSSQLVTGIKFQIASLLLCCFTISITCRSWHSLPSGEQHNKISCTRPSILQLYDEYSYKNKGILHEEFLCYRNDI